MKCYFSFSGCNNDGEIAAIVAMQVGKVVDPVYDPLTLMPATPVYKLVCEDCWGKYLHYRLTPEEFMAKELLTIANRMLT